MASNRIYDAKNSSRDTQTDKKIIIHLFEIMIFDLIFRKLIRKIDNGINQVVKETDKKCVLLFTLISQCAFLFSNLLIFDIFGIFKDTSIFFSWHN